MKAWQPMRSLWRRISAPERGFTLVEMSVTSGILLLLVTGMLAMFMTMQRTAVRQQSRSETADQVRFTMDRMLKEVRQAYDIIPGSTTSYLEMDTFVGGVAKRIIYDARTPNVLTRTEDGNTIVLLERLDVTTVWSYSPDVTDPSVITVTLIAYPDKFESDDTTVELTSEVKLRNRSGVDS